MKEMRRLKLISELLKRHRAHRKKPVVCEKCGAGPFTNLPLGWFQTGRSKFKGLVEDQLAAWCPKCVPNRRFA